MGRMQIPPPPDRQPTITVCDRSRSRVAIFSRSRSRATCGVSGALDSLSGHSQVFCFQVVEILVQEKVQNLSGNARKSLVGILTAIVLRSSEEDVHISTARELVQQVRSASDAVGAAVTAGCPLRWRQTADGVGACSRPPLEPLRLCSLVLGMAKNAFLRKKAFFHSQLLRVVLLKLLLV